MCVSSSGKKVLFGTPHAADNQKTPLWPTFLHLHDLVFVFAEKTGFGVFSYTNYWGGPRNLYRKNRSKNAKNPVFFFVKNEKHPLGVEEGGPKWCFLIVGGVRRS